MIYFDNNKTAYAYEIENPLSTLDDEIWKNYAGKDNWDIINGEFVDISNTDEYKEKQTKEKEEEFNKNFFNTSLGYIRREVSMKTGEIKSFLFDILPVLQEGVSIVTYNKNGTQNTNVLVTNEFINECKNQILKDFYGDIRGIE